MIMIYSIANNLEAPIWKSESGKVIMQYTVELGDEELFGHPKTVP